MVFWGLVLARGSSKSIPHKNIQLLDNKPLIGWVLEPMKNSAVFDDIWVSTDDKQIASIAQSYGVKVHDRSQESATDSSSSLAAILEFIKTHRGADQICLVQCTSPFLREQYLKSAYHLMIDQKYDSVFSVYRSHCLRWSIGLNALNFDEHCRPRRQDWTGEYVESGHFYCFTTALVQNDGILQGGKCGVIEIPKKFCLEIDDMFDLQLAKYYRNFF
ncbi:N-acylneuraminate cytidylyltransferase A-like [Oppia nitens]|uniref:N-acylneuraminate cytidylyltransferase A-like n=1 Tax=Oppia nitens TaxID=1686743 RepID=UPI0023DAD015|nr:N-acylneuraminate cytidylyltransferase A-like [Oppia nitens]